MDPNDATPALKLPSPPLEALYRQQVALDWMEGVQTMLTLSGELSTLAHLRASNLARCSPASEQQEQRTTTTMILMYATCLRIQEAQQNRFWGFLPVRWGAREQEIYSSYFVSVRPKTPPYRPRKDSKSKRWKAATGAFYLRLGKRRDYLGPLTFSEGVLRSIRAPSCLRNEDDKALLAVQALVKLVRAAEDVDFLLTCDHTKALSAMTL